MDEGLVYLSLFLSCMEEGSYVGGSLCFVFFVCFVFVFSSCYCVFGLEGMQFCGMVWRNRTFVAGSHHNVEVC